LLLVEAGLPTPQSQIPVVANWRTVAVLDMGWERFKVAVEYDGDQHRSNRRQYVRDIRRLKRLEELGWIIIRVIAEDRPDKVVRSVLEALRRRGYPTLTSGTQHAEAGVPDLNLGGRNGATTVRSYYAT
jgi:hypothetical protein